MARVLMWASAFWPSIGGVEVLGEKLVRALSKRGHEFAVITNQPGVFPDYSLHHGVPIHRLSMMPVFRSGDVEQWVAVRNKVAAIKQQHRPQLIWNYLVQFDCMFDLMTRAVFPAPSVATVHGEFQDREFMSNSVIRQLLQKSNWVAACSTASLDAALVRLPELRERSSVIPNALEMPAFEPAPIRFVPPRLVTLGRMQDMHEKGFDVAIDAMPQILERFPSARLVIAGDGAGHAPLEAHAAHVGVAHAVDFPGWIRPDHVPEFLNDATLVLMPSRVAEGFGLVALQGQQMARPVVASRSGGIVDVVKDGETGLLVEPENPKALADAILRLLSNPDLAVEMGRAARERASCTFSFDAHVDAYDELLSRFSAKTVS